jgi:hypothetical protein
VEYSVLQQEGHGKNGEYVEFPISIHGSSWRKCIGSRRQKFLAIWMYSLGDLRVKSTSSVLFSHRILWFCICAVQEWHFPQQVIFFKGHFYSVPVCFFYWPPFQTQSCLVVKSSCCPSIYCSLNCQVCSLPNLPNPK